MGKPICDEEIVELISKIISDLPGKRMCLKVFQIVGYPWETPESVRDDILAFRALLGRVKSGPGRVVMMFTITPFSPEPLTQMEDDPANITVRWRDILLDDSLRCVYDSPHLNAFILPQIPGPVTLFKRVAVNRGVSVDKLRAIHRSATIEECLNVCGDVTQRGAGVRVSRILSRESFPKSPGHRSGRIR